jgi:hypothetical protein
MTDIQISLPLLIVWPSILNLVINFSTHLWSVKYKCPRLYLCLAHSIPFPSMLMQHMHQPITKWYDSLHIIMWSYWFIDLDLTCSSPLPQSIGAKSSTYPSHSQPVRRAKPYLDLHLGHMTSCHVSYAMSSFIITCELCTKSKPSSPSWHMLLTHMYLWINHLCISHKHMLVHLSYHSITKTK